MATCEANGQTIPDHTPTNQLDAPITVALVTAEFREATQAFAREMTAGAPVAIGVAKMMVYQALETSLTVHGRFDFLGQQYCFNTEDREEGINSFLEKRPADFKGS